MAILSTSSVLLLYFGMVIALIIIRVRKYPRPEGAFRIPGGYIVPVLAGITIIWFLTHLKLKEFIAIAAIIAALTLVYFTLIPKRNRPDSGTRH
jgi:APA family basic amino acid/polyamine antiporter